MKALIKIVATAVVAAWIPNAAADNAATAQPSAALTWNRIALEAVERAKPTQHQAIRLLTHVSLAQHAALGDAAADAGRADAVATASMRVIAELLPSQAGFVEERHRQLQSTESVQGQRVAQSTLAWARDDGFSTAWSGRAPDGAAYAWRSLVQPPAPPAYPAVGNMRMFFVEPAGIRPPPPPALGGAQFLTDLAEVRRHVTAPNVETTRLAKFYDMTTGTMVAGFWNERAAALVRRDAIGERQATAMLATMNAAMMDAIASCHDAKYAYWVPRPSQADPTIKAVIGVPNHPSYPSNHACVSTAAALVLAHFFPQARAELEATAAEAGLSRIYAGIHYRFDVDAGEGIGRNVAAAAIARYPQMLAQWTRAENVAQEASR